MALFKKNYQNVTLKISGMHCTSCVMNINGAVEDLAGVVSCDAHFAKQEARVVYNPDQITLEEIQAEIEKNGYSVLHT